MYGFVYDTRIIKAHWIDGTQRKAHKNKRGKRNVKRTHIKKD